MKMLIVINKETLAKIQDPILEDGPSRGGFDPAAELLTAYLLRALDTTNGMRGTLYESSPYITGGLTRCG